MGHEPHILWGSGPQALGFGTSREADKIARSWGQLPGPGLALPEMLLGRVKSTQGPGAAPRSSNLPLSAAGVTCLW